MIRNPRRARSGGEPRIVRRWPRRCRRRASPATSWSAVRNNRTPFWCFPPVPEQKAPVLAQHSRRRLIYRGRPVTRQVAATGAAGRDAGEEQRRAACGVLLAHPDPGGPPRARDPSPRPPTGGWGCAAGRMDLHARGAVAPGDTFRVPYRLRTFDNLVAIRCARPPPAVRRRDRRARKG